MKLDFLRFEYRVSLPSAAHAFEALVKRTREAGHDVEPRYYGNALVHQSRNKALAQVREDTDAVLFVDDDMVAQPDAVLRLMEHKMPVVSACCTTRSFPVQYAAKIYDETQDRFVAMNWFKPGRLFIGKIAVGAAFLYVERDVVTRLIEHYLSARDWLEDNRPQMDRMRVRSELREAERKRKEEIRRKRYAADKTTARVFDFPVIDNEEQLGEDICLSRRLIQLGIPVALDSAVLVGHIGDYLYGPWDIGRDEESAVA